MNDTLYRCNQNFIKDINLEKVNFKKKENDNLKKTYKCLENLCNIQIELLKIKKFKDELHWHEFKVNDHKIIYLKIY